MDNFECLIIDNGSRTIKAGFSGEDSPASVFLNIVKRPKYAPRIVGMMHKDAYVGDEAQIRRNVPMIVSQSVSKGLITKWEDIEKVWLHTFYNELRRDPQEHPILMSDVCWNTTKNREKMSEICFETILVPSLNISNQSSLSLFASGKSTGVVFDSGYEVSRSIPVFEGLALSDSVSTFDYAGKEITHYLFDLLIEKGYNITPTSEMEIVGDVKEKLGLVAKDFNKEMERNEKKLEEMERKTYELPDGQIIKIGYERFKMVEPMFDGKLFENIFSIQNSIFYSILKNEIDLSNVFFSNIFLSGGSTMFSGMAERIERELKIKLEKEISKEMEVKVFSPPTRKYSCWIGASIFSSLSNFQTHCISKDLYGEYGPSIIRTKFF